MRVGILPFGFKYAGIVLFLAGLVLSYLVFANNYKPDFLNIPVFAVYSAYMSKTIFGITQTNLADELAIILNLTGLAFLAFSREKNEKSHFETTRAKALLYAVLMNIVFLLLCTLFIFGTGYIAVLIINIFSILTFYLIFYYAFLIKSLQK